jgi:hypothetical protein
MIFLWVKHELSYDRFHVIYDRIFRAIEHEELSGEEVPFHSQQAPVLGSVYLLLPALPQLSGKEMSFSMLFQGNMIYRVFNRLHS